MNTWQQRIRELQDAGMTQAEIAAEVGLTPGSVSDIANNRSSSPRGDAALKLDALHRAKCPSSDEAA